MSRSPVMEGESSCLLSSDSRLIAMRSLPDYLAEAREKKFKAEDALANIKKAQTDFDIVTIRYRNFHNKDLTPAMKATSQQLLDQSQPKLETSHKRAKKVLAKRDRAMKKALLRYEREAAGKGANAGGQAKGEEDDDVIVTGERRVGVAATNRANNAALGRIGEPAAGVVVPPPQATATEEQQPPRPMGHYPWQVLTGTYSTQDARRATDAQPAHLKGTLADPDVDHDYVNGPGPNAYKMNPYWPWIWPTIMQVRGPERGWD